jgi:hypothetical protein
MGTLSEYVTGAIWIHAYPVRYSGLDLFGRMTLIRLGTSELIVHDPCRIDATTKLEIDQIGEWCRQLAATLPSPRALPTYTSVPPSSVSAPSRPIWIRPDGGDASRTA